MKPADILRMIGRKSNQFYAWLCGYFWLPCPSCGEFFGGHEWTWGNSSIDGKGICPKCTRDGKGNNTLYVQAIAYERGGGMNL